MIKKSIDMINKINNKTLYDYSEIQVFSKYIEFILSSEKYEFMNYGGNCIVFNNDNYVLKICRQNKNIYTKFLLYDEILGDIIPVVPTEKIYYADEKYIVYTQKKCDIIDTLSIADIIDIIEIYINMIKNKIIFRDIYFRNFGKINNKILLFDYHYDYESTPDPSDIHNMILNLLCVFGGPHYEDYVNEGIRRSYEEYALNNFAIPNVPECFSELLRILHNIYLSNTSNNEILNNQLQKIKLHQNSVCADNNSDNSESNTHISDTYIISETYDDISVNNPDNHNDDSPYVRDMYERFV